MSLAYDFAPRTGAAISRGTDTSVRDVMLAAIPGLRAFAISLCANPDYTDDLVQETLIRALANINSFEPGTNMPAWLITILRNHFHSEYRKRRREVEDTTGGYADHLRSPPEQEGYVKLLSVKNPEDYGPDQTVRAVLATSDFMRGK